MPVRPIAVAAALTAAALCAVVVRRHCTLRRALLAERAVRRLEGAAHIRDLEAFSIRFHAVLEDRAVLDAADLVLDSALATHHNPEGGST
ncbi:hypothetical protein [Streptomyces sp. NBC_01483]|uniref:hypothetical protein n=1 Tax=Streptomyces sp. NBC_01483 TaxID=2903883 RepID=UPI002E35310C|nr:hypothetical protein [Streptomyces sp. NBC_01483]